MMTRWSSEPGARVLRGTESQEVTPAHLGADLRRAPGATDRSRGVDRWLDRATAAVTESVREAARAEGYAQGYAEGRRAAAEAAQAAQKRREAEQAAADRRHAEELHRALGAVERAATRLEQDAAAAAAETERTLAEAAFSLLETLVGRELELAAHPGLDAVRRALALAPHARPVTLRLNPADAAALGSSAGWAGGREVTVAPDPSVAIGDCVADCDATRIDARIAPALARVREVLVP
jgi:flagellar assembly protein FliH